MNAGALSRVSEEVGGSFRDSVNAFDPCKVAAEVESVLFDNWGFRDIQVLVGEIPPEMLLNMSFEQLQQMYPLTPSYLDYVAPK
ncbi:hypothetical protein D8674_025138 [Pyrus ussuriensis x Pyrus communis]|uniref:Uncharacterized protein n=1 Tax=Pyrus ussuriensis x Pyrus communis TaxID=2448454 RepID=A0A5N5H4T4_9ROSA|nr:hypothetical protein D8674_025138 [Pyrus ussuriensis x Pyrus communis]